MLEDILADGFLGTEYLERALALPAMGVMV